MNSYLLTFAAVTFCVLLAFLAVVFFLAMLDRLFNMGSEFPLRDPKYKRRAVVSSERQWSLKNDRKRR